MTDRSEAAVGRASGLVGDLLETNCIGIEINPLFGVLARLAAGGHQQTHQRDRFPHDCATKDRAQR